MRGYLVDLSPNLRDALLVTRANDVVVADVATDRAIWRVRGYPYARWAADGRTITLGRFGESEAGGPVRFDRFVVLDLLTGTSRPLPGRYGYPDDGYTAAAGLRRLIVSFETDWGYGIPDLHSAWPGDRLRVAPVFTPQLVVAHATSLAPGAQAHAF